MATRGPTQTTPHGRVMLTVLGGSPEFERELIRARTTEDRGRAVARRVKRGRKPKPAGHQMRLAIKRRDAGEQVRKIAQLQRPPQHDFEVAA